MQGDVPTLEPAKAPMRSASAVSSASSQEPPQLRRLIDIQTLSELWSIPVSTLYNWVNQKRIPYVKIGRCVRFDPTDIRVHVERAKIGTRAAAKR